MSNTNTAMTTEEHITASAATRGIELTPDQLSFAVATLEADIEAHAQRVASWIAAGVEYSESAATCNVEAKARTAIRDALATW